MTDAERERLIEAWRTIRDLETKPTARTRALWALRTSSTNSLR